MKTNQFFFSLLLAFITLNVVNAQIGVNTTNPKATFDVNLQPNYSVGDKAGITVPILNGDQIESMNTTDLKLGTLIFSTSASTATVKDVDAPGYWYWNGSVSKWESLVAEPSKFFYSPSIQLITDQSNPNFGTIDLYNSYKQQFSAPLVSSAGSIGSVPVYSSNKLEYYVTWYDMNIFENVQITATGVLTYSVKAGADTSKPTYMNVVFRVK